MLDNANAETFDYNDILGCFLNGYNRETDRQYISGGKGENIEFRVFCPKAITTIWDVESKELLRRTLVIRTKKSRDLEGIGDDIPELPSLKSEVQKFWGKPENYSTFVAFRRSAQLKWKKGCPLSKEQLHLVADLIAAGCTASVWEEPSEALEQFHKLFVAIESRTTLLETVVIEALETITGQKRDDWSKLPATIRIEVTPKALKQAVDTAVSDGLIPRPHLAKVQEIVAANGFVPHKAVSGIVYHFRGR